MQTDAVTAADRIAVESCQPHVEHALGGPSGVQRLPEVGLVERVHQPGRADRRRAGQCGNHYRDH
jgi:hypothetical protein